MSKELLSSKVIVEEEEPKVRGISSAPTSVAGAVGITERGPIGVATLCNSFDDYESTFGGFSANSELALAAMGFFQNGGSELWVVRTAHYADVSNPLAVTAMSSFVTLPNGATDILTVQAKECGAFGNRLKVEIRAATNGQVGYFDLLVLDDGVYRETFPNLTLTATAARYVETIVNDASSGSRLIKATDLHPASSTVLALGTYSLTGGSDGLVGLTDADFVGTDAGKTGLHALDAVQSLSLLIVPGRATPAVHAAMLAYAEVEREGTVFAILDPPAAQSATAIVTYVSTTAALENASEYGAIYWPRIKVLNAKKCVFSSVD